ncbi:MAG: tRNA pseudouridine38-40 synthase [Flavobacteriales bacterium]
MRLFLEIAYDGTDFSGWQIQKNAMTVQETVNDSLSMLLRAPIETIGCGRTDAGVHASQFFLHFDIEELAWSLADFVFKLNGILPKSISAKKATSVPEGSHTRFDASARSYSYCIHRFKDPFKWQFSAFVRFDLNVDLMNEACALLILEKDFAAFCKAGSDIKTTLCDVRHAQWIVEKDTLRFDITADRFLRNMVRAIVGTTIDLGRGYIDLDQFKEILKSKERSKASASADACGLFLTKVEYPFL